MPPYYPKLWYLPTDTFHRFIETPLMAWVCSQLLTPTRCASHMLPMIVKWYKDRKFTLPQGLFGATSWELIYAIRHQWSQPCFTETKHIDETYRLSQFCDKSMIREAVHEPVNTIRRCGSGRVSAHEILLRTRGGKRKAAYCPNQMVRPFNSRKC